MRKGPVAQRQCPRVLIKREGDGATVGLDGQILYRDRRHFQDVVPFSETDIRIYLVRKFDGTGYGRHIRNLDINRVFAGIELHMERYPVIPFPLRRKLRDRNEAPSFPDDAQFTVAVQTIIKEIDDRLLFPGRNELENVPEGRILVAPEFEINA